MKASCESLAAQAAGLASSCSLRRNGRSNERPDERSQTDILTWGLNLAPAFPSCCGQWPVGGCSPLQWRNRTGFSPGSLTLDCIQGEHPFAGFKERNTSTLRLKFWQEQLGRKN